VKGRRLEFDGVTFMLMGTAVYDCQQGKDRNTALKMRTQKKKRKRLKQKKKHRVEKEGCVEEDTSYIEENVLWKKNVFMCKYLTSVIIQGTQWER